MIKIPLSKMGVAGLLALCCVGSVAAQSSWPVKPLRFIVPVLPGSFTDIGARAIAAEMSEQLGQQVIVENRPGAGTTIGADHVAKAAPDGYTMLFTENSFTVSPSLYPKLPYDSVKDFAPVTIVAEAPTLMWSRVDLSAKNPQELVALAKSDPKLLTFGSGGQGTSSHLAGELFFDVAKIKVVHIPFKGVAASINEVMAGHVDFGTSSIASPMGQIKAGRLKAIGVTGQTRSALLPDVPTFAESGFPQYDAPIWFGVLVPAATPAPIVARLHQELARAINKPKIRDTFGAQGATVVDVSSQEFGRRIASEIAQWRDLINRNGIKIE